MPIALVITALYVGLAYLVFVRFKWLKFSITWGVICALTGMHVVLVFLIGMHFMTPYSTDARVIQHTIQLVPRLPEPTLVTAVLVKANTAVKKGQPLFQFDRTPYENKVKEQQAALAAARQNVLGLENDVTTAQAAVARARAQRVALDAQHGILKSNLRLAEVNLVKAQAARDYAKLQYERYQTLAKIDAEAVETFEKWDYDFREKEGTVTEAATSIDKARLQLTLWDSDVVAADATVREAQDNVRKAQLAATSKIDGVNTTVARLEAQLAQAQYYLDNTTMVALVDGMIVNLQVEPGMVAGIVRFGSAQQEKAIANYATVALNAFREVAAALDNERVLAERLQYQNQALANRVEAVQVATARYRAGALSLQPVLQLQAEQLATEAAIVKLRDAQLANRVTLHLALGGGFDAAPAAAVPRDTRPVRDSR